MSFMCPRCPPIENQTTKTVTVRTFKSRQGLNAHMAVHKKANLFTYEELKKTMFTEAEVKEVAEEYANLWMHGGRPEEIQKIIEKVKAKR